jgi:hypothetical protein
VPNYLSPGVYVEEVSSGPRPIEGVSTSTAGFLGVAPKADAHLQDPMAVNNWSQFLREFCDDDSKSTPLAQGVRGFFENGGSRCFVLNVGKGGSIAAGMSKGHRQGIALFEENDEISIVAAPGASDAASFQTLIGHCYDMKDRVAILDAPEEVQRIEDLTKVAAPPVPGAPPAAGNAGGAARPPQNDKGVAAFYFPYITVRDALDPTRLVNVPPSGHLAGIYARTDATRGVFKAPANEPIIGALNVTYRVTRQEQEVLNPAGVNCIRFFLDSGIKVWGARTIAEASNPWRYVNVRRLFIYIEQSIGRGTNWCVFEPNDLTLWKSVKRDVDAFLTRLWRDGALMGARPEDAFFVKCDAETNPPESVDAGQLVVQVGVAPVKPAEFVIFRIGQHASGTNIQSEGGHA